MERPGSLWRRILGLLSDAWVHLDFCLPLGLAALSLWRLELLLVWLGLGSWWVRKNMVTCHRGPQCSSGMDHANSSAPSAVFTSGRSASFAATAGCCGSRTGRQRPVGIPRGTRASPRSPVAG